MHSVKESKRRLKLFLKVYSSRGDQRFDWLQGTFLLYLTSWKENVNNRPENLTQDVKMFLVWQTFEGTQITIFLLIEVVKHLLDQGMPFVLSERFCQDLVEDYFGNQRYMVRHSDNPDINQFGYATILYKSRGHGKNLVMKKYQNGVKQNKTTYLYFQY